MIDVRGTVFIRCAVTCNRASRSRRLRAAGLERAPPFGVVVPPFGVQGKGEAPPFGVPPREGAGTPKSEHESPTAAYTSVLPSMIAATEAVEPPSTASSLVRVRVRVGVRVRVRVRVHLLAQRVQRHACSARQSESVLAPAEHGANKERGLETELANGDAVERAELVQVDAVAEEGLALHVQRAEAWQPGDEGGVVQVRVLDAHR